MKKIFLSLFIITSLILFVSCKKTDNIDESFAQIVNDLSSYKLVGKLESNFPSGTKECVVTVYYKKPNMLSQITLSPIDGTPGQTIGPAAENTDKTDLRPIIIGVIIAVVVLAVGFYIIFVEVPYRKKRAAYLARRRRERERF